MIRAYFGSLMGSGVPIVDGSPEEISVLGGVKHFKKSVQSFQLIAAQGLDREKVQSPLFMVLQERLRDPPDCRSETSRLR